MRLQAFHLPSLQPYEARKIDDCRGHRPLIHAHRVLIRHVDLVSVSKGNCGLQA
jgi:hypothetical protein